MSARKMTTPNVWAILADGTEVEVQTILADAIAWDHTRAKHKWPDMKEAPLTWMAFLAWHALRRTGQTALTWDEFSGGVQAVGDAGSEEVDPTQSAPTPE